MELRKMSLALRTEGCFDTFVEKNAESVKVT